MDLFLAAIAAWASTTVAAICGGYAGVELAHGDVSSAIKWVLYVFLSAVSGGGAVWMLCSL